MKSVEEFNKAVDAGKDPFGRTLFDQKIDTAHSMQRNAFQRFTTLWVEFKLTRNQKC